MDNMVLNTGVWEEWFNHYVQQKGSTNCTYFQLTIQLKYPCTSARPLRIALWKRKAKLLNNFPRSQLPPLITWNGVPNRFNIDYWKTTKQNDSSVPIPNSTKSLQINDSSATEATLRGLNRYVEYQTQISMCTAEGCGPKSVPWPLEGLSLCVPFERYFCSGRINAGLL